jgi:hypothetical protein
MDMFFLMAACRREEEEAVGLWMEVVVVVVDMLKRGIKSVEVLGLCIIGVWLL